MLYEDIKIPVAKRIEGIYKIYMRIEAKMKELMMDNDFPIVISGDHSNAGGTIAGIKSAYPNSRLGVIWIDAHADLHSPYTSPSGNVHGMPLSTAVSENNLDCKTVNVPEETAKLWDALKGEEPRLSYDDLLFIGVRDYEKPEEYLLIRNKVPNITVSEYREIGHDAFLERVMKRMEGCDKIYVSFDVDSMDPTISRGTGTPVEDGFQAEEVEKIILSLMDDPRLCCFEITEVNPVLDDKGNAMAETAFKILNSVHTKLKAKFAK